MCPGRGSNLVSDYFCRDVLDRELTRLDKLSSEVVLNGGVLRPWMEGWVLCKRECPLGYRRGRG